MEKIVKDLQLRGIVKDVTNMDKLKQLKKEDGIYIGFDPTAESLHLGNYVQMSLLKRFQNYGQKVVAVLGGATGMIGDPSFKDGERALLDTNTILKNKSAIKNQLQAVGLEVFDNYDIYKDMNILDFLRDVGKNMNISVMMSRDSVASRIDKGLSFTEFSYQLIQGWDFKYLYENKNVKVQVGGSDQWGNIVTGVDLIRKTLGENNVAVGITANLLTDSAGNKFGKSTGGGSLWLDKNKTSPFAMYQFLVNQSDTEVIKLLKWLTFLSLEDIQKIEEEHKIAPHLRKAQKTLAYEIIKDIHGIDEAENAIKITQILFSSNSLDELTLNDFEQFKGALPFFEIDQNTTLTEAILLSQAAKSKRELNEFLSSKTFELNGSKEFDVNTLVKDLKFLDNYFVLKKGKRNYFIFKVNE